MNHSETLISSAAPRGAKSRRTHRRLVEATRAEIEACGSFTAERVASRAGLSPATFWAYFPSKEEALVAAFTSVLDDLVERVDELLSLERLLEEGLARRCRAWAGAMAGFFSRHSKVFRAAQAAMSASASLRETYRQHEAAAFERYRHFLRLGQRAGQVREAELEPLARGLMVLTQGFHNPLLFGLAPEDPVFDELARALQAFLAPVSGVRPGGDLEIGAE